jgi:hypothetical protein
VTARKPRPAATLETLRTEQDRAAGEQGEMHAEQVRVASEHGREHSAEVRAASTNAAVALERLAFLEKQQENTDKWQDRQNGALVRLADGQARMTGVIDCLEDKMALRIESFEGKIETKMDNFQGTMREDLKRVYFAIMGFGGAFVVGLIGTIVTLVVTHTLH